MEQLLAIAIDKDKSSQAALRWAVDNLVERGDTVCLVHVKNKASQNMSEEMYRREIFLPFRCYGTRKEVHCKDIHLEGSNVAKAILEFISENSIDKLVVGASRKNAFMRFKTGDVPSSITKGAPDFCTVYVISKEKPSSIKKASREAPAVSPLRVEIQNNKQKLLQVNTKRSLENPLLPSRLSTGRSPSYCSPSYRSFEERSDTRSPFSRGSHSVQQHYYSGISPLNDTDISFVSSGRPSSDRMFPSFDENEQPHKPPRLSNLSNHNADMMRTPQKSSDTQLLGSEYSGFSHESNLSSSSSQTMEEVEAEMRRLKLELKHTINMYSTACKEALDAKKKENELSHWKMEEEKRMKEAKMGEETAVAIAEREKAKCKVAIEEAEAARRIAESESRKRIDAEMKSLEKEEDKGEEEEKNKAVESEGYSNGTYRKYTIDEIEIATNYFEADRKIGEGGYGPVFKCCIDHTVVAVKVLRPDASQGRSQFQQEVEVLSCIRHPNMVLLLGACPEYGCLVYEYMANGSLEDRLLRRGDTPVLSWRSRFRIAAEITTGLLFLHQTKPEPLVHRDLKPANILLDKNLVSKISDVGLARLIPCCSTADSATTHYRMTSAAGTFCYIDPEYQQTGMLGVKSDVYSLGIMLLQIITAKAPMGLAHQVEASIEDGMFASMLDPAVLDWPLDEALCFAKIAMRCAQLRRKDRPDLGSVVLPELNKLREFASL